MMTEEKLIAIVACPACGSRLQSFDRCRTCDLAFREDSVPSLIPADTSREVAFRFTSSRSVRPDDFRSVFRYPPATEAMPDGPYHLDRAHDRILREIPAGALVLEIGCGGGQMREYVVARGLEYVGVDISPSERVHDHLKRHGGPDLLCDSHFLPFPPESVNAVYSVAVFEHLGSPYLAAQQVFRALKPGGHFLGTVSFLEPWHDDSFFHMTPLGVREMLIQAGFEVDYIWPVARWSGFRALMKMGNKATAMLSFLGDALNLAYRAGSWIKTKARPGGTSQIEEQARLAGAIAWIAHKPL